MPRYLIIDAETTGLAKPTLPADHPDQPRMASLCMIWTDEDGEPVRVESMLVQPDGWTISPEIEGLSGLSTERCATEGRPIREVLDIYSQAIRDGYVVVAFNAQFDLKVCRGELRRAGMPDLFEQTPNICVMRASTKLNVPKAGPKKGGFPKLTDVYRHLFNVEHAPHHTAASDAQACLEIFQELLHRVMIPEPAVHFAKVPPPGKAVEAEAS